MVELLKAFVEPTVLVAFLTFVVGPVLVVLVTNRRSKNKAAENVSVAESLPKPGKANLTTQGSAALVDAMLAWAGEQRGSRDETNTRLRDLYRELDQMRDRLAELEKTVALLRQHNAVLISQVRELGGRPYLLNDVS